MKKILFLIESLHLGGAEKSLISLLNNLDLSEYQINLLLLKQGGEFEKFVPKEIKKEFIKYNPGIGERIKFKVLKLLNHNKKFHNAQLFWKSIQSKIPEYNEDFDIAIAWGQGFATYYVSKKVRALKKIAWINTDYQKAGYYAPQDRLIYNNFNHIVGVSSFVQKEIQKTFPNNNVLFIRDIIDDIEIVEKSIAKKVIDFQVEQINIVSVGRLVKPKSFDLAINALNVIRQKGYNAHLYIIGEGGERKSLEHLIKELELQNSCTLLGYLENPFPYIKDCDIYLQSSIFEGLGRTLIEAGILKKPIVTTNFPTAYQILKKNETGVIVDMNAEKIAEAIVKLVENEDFKNKLIENLRKQTQKETQKTLYAINSLLNEKADIQLH